MTIEIVKVRAEIMVGGLRFTTPNDESDGIINSFSVNKSRTQISSFSATIKAKYASMVDRLTNGIVVISAGVEGNINKIFTGIIKKASITPCWDDPAFVSLNLSGTDSMSLLEGKKYTRRCRATKSTWISITGVVRKGLRSGKFKARVKPVVLLTGDELSSDSSTIKNIPAEYSKVGGDGVAGTITKIFANYNSTPVPTRGEE